MFGFYFAFSVVVFVSLCAIVVYQSWLFRKSSKDLTRTHSQTVSELLDRLAYAQGKPFNYPERIPAANTEEETPKEEGWHEL